MNESISSQIENKIKRSKPGQIILPSDFKDLGTSTAIRKTLSRLVDQKVLVRMGQGVYVVPIHDKLFGEVLPSMEEIAASLAEKEHVKIMPTGQYALNKIGLSNQVPMKMVFLTNGTKKNITEGAKVLENAINRSIITEGDLLEANVLLVKLLVKINKIKE
jgi:predicted transcriptional regulator of viral defense system